MNTLTVGMATYQDFDGCYFTITGLRANHPPVDLVVVDNHPTGCPRTRDVCLANGGRYFHKPNLHGTSAPRDEVFRLSHTPWTMCVDSHVLFETGAIESLIRYAEAHPESPDLVQGPLIYDNGQPTTHWRATHPPGLWGVWMRAWVHLASGRAFDVLRLGNGTVAMESLMPGDPLPIPAMLPDERHEQELRSAGCVPGDEHDRPFEIPMQGLGAWAMRTAAWPGFNSLFTGFGGEEGYIHELVRRKGGRALCLPALRWRHRFHDQTKPTPYDNAPEHHTWNLLIGHRELGIEATEPIRQAHGSRCGPGAFEPLVPGAAQAQPWNVPGERPAPLKVLGIWYSNNAAPPKVLKASLDSIKRAADLSRADVAVVTCPWEPIEGNPFAVGIPRFGETLAKFKDGPGHLNIVRQQKQCIQSYRHEYSVRNGRNWHSVPMPDVICFLEHDVLYPPDYFDRVAKALRENPAAPVVSNLDYIGLNGTGWLQVKERHEPMHQLSMRYDFAVANLDRCEQEVLATGICLLEPQGDRSNWVRIPPRGKMPAVHINHAKRLTSHGEVVFEADSRGMIAHPFWGSAANYWDGGVQSTVTTGGCNTCGTAATPAVPPPPPFASMADWLADAEKRPSDFHEHVPTLKALADQCEVVAEIGIWDDKPAIVALAASNAKRVISVCPLPKRVWNGVRGLRPEGFEAVADDGPVRDGVDLLFLDERHRAHDVFEGLAKYAPHVRRYLVVHCTTAPYGESGDDGGPGVMPGVRRFLNENREWTAIRHDHGTHGLIVLSRDDRDKKQPPGLIRQAMNFTSAKYKHLAAGKPMVSEQVYHERLAECVTCPERAGDQCAACGCPIEAKAAWATEECGLVKLGRVPKWTAV